MRVPNVYREYLTPAETVTVRGVVISSANLFGTEYDYSHGLELFTIYFNVRLTSCFFCCSSQDLLEDMMPKTSTCSVPYCNVVDGDPTKMAMITQLP